MTGFCAANLALGYPHNYGYAGVMSGYFTLMDNINAGRPVDPFRGRVSGLARSDIAHA